MAELKGLLAGCDTINCQYLDNRHDQLPHFTVTWSVVTGQVWHFLEWFQHGEQHTWREKWSRLGSRLELNRYDIWPWPVDEPFWWQLILIVNVEWIQIIERDPGFIELAHRAGLHYIFCFQFGLRLLDTRSPEGCDYEVQHSHTSFVLAGSQPGMQHYYYGDLARYKERHFGDTVSGLQLEIIREKC